MCDDCLFRKQINQQQPGVTTAQQSTDSTAKKAPPLPPRPGQGSRYNSTSNYYGDSLGGLSGGYAGYGGYSMMSPFAGGYGGYGMGGYGGYGAGYGGYGSRYGMYGQGPSTGDENDFVRIAEESSRQAFQSIESIVHAFGSVSMMLESTYFAVHSSFRAVLGVADHITRLKGHMTQVVSSTTIIRSLTLFLRRLLYILGLRDTDPTSETAWREAAQQQSMTPEAVAEALMKPDKKSSWPIMMFFAVVFGTPWLIWKLLLSLSGEPSARKWMQGQGNHYIAKGLYDFVTNNPREVAFTVGQRIIIAPKEKQPNVRGWLLASVDGVKVGLVPVSYVEIVAFCPQEHNPSAISVPVDQVIESQPVSSSPSVDLEASLLEPPSRETAPLDQDKQ